MTIIARGTGQWIVPSTSAVGVAYLVKSHAGQLTCDCAAGYHRGRCKHIAAVATTLKSAPTTSGPSAQETALLFMAPRHRS